MHHRMLYPLTRQGHTCHHHDVDATGAQVGVADSGDGRRHRPADPCSACRRPRCSPRWSSAIVLALARWLPAGYPARIGIAAQGVLGVYIGTMVHRDAVGALGSDWPIVLAVAVATLLLSVVAGALLGAAPRRQPADRVAGAGRRRRVRPGRHRSRTRRRRPRRRRRAVPAGRAGHRVDAGGRDAGLSRRQDRTTPQPVTQTDSAPWYLSIAMLDRAGAGRRDRRHG